jgi:hypothetical protein
MAITAEALRRRGIDLTPEDCLHLLEEAILQLPEVGVSGSATDELADWEVEELRAGGLDLSPPRPDELDPLAATAAQYAALLGASLTVSQAARRLGVDPSRLRQRLAARTLFGIKLSDGWRLPLFQFDGDRLIPGLASVLPRLPRDRHPLAIITWFESPDADLEIDDRPVSPRDWLRSGGDPTAVVPPRPQV